MGEALERLLALTQVKEHASHSGKGKVEVVRAHELHPGDLIKHQGKTAKVKAVMTEPFGHNVMHSEGDTFVPKGGTIERHGHEAPEKPKKKDPKKALPVPPHAIPGVGSSKVSGKLQHSKVSRWGS